MMDELKETKIKSKLSAARLICSGICIVVIVVLDQLLKYWAITDLKPKGTMDFLKIGSLDILGFCYLENTGAVFGSFDGMRWILIAVTAVLCIGCIYLLIRYSRNAKLLLTSLTLIVGGGFGNMIDRIFRNGHVVDYIEVRLFHFAIFNFADCCVVIGVALLTIYLLFHPEQRKPKVQTKPEDESHA
ncbi:MAG: signal peptidase II [Ruminococcus sp.]|nr:signal peptidase II [Ruminococcus sp.]